MTTATGNVDTIGGAGVQTKPAMQNMAQADYCTSCGRLLQSTEKANAELLQEQERLLKEINAAKEELANKLKETNLAESEEKKEEEEGKEASGQLFNHKNMNSLQELLDKAEETNDMLLFMDKNQNTWQIMKRNDINITDNEEENEEQEAEGNEVAAPNEERKNNDEQ